MANYTVAISSYAATPGVMGVQLSGGAWLTFPAGSLVPIYDAMNGGFGLKYNANDTDWVAPMCSVGGVAPYAGTLGCFMDGMEVLINSFADLIIFLQQNFFFDVSGSGSSGVLASGTAQLVAGTIDILIGLTTNIPIISLVLLTVYIGTGVSNTLGTLVYDLISDGTNTELVVTSFSSGGVENITDTSTFSYVIFPG